MTECHAHISLITLGVDDLVRSARFYETLGFVRKARGSGEEVAFFAAGGVVLALFGWDHLAADAMVQSAPRPTGFRGSALAWNCATPGEVDQVLIRAAKAGGHVLKTARKVFWGGYSGYFADPDGHAWEVAHNPHFALASDGRLTLPD